jgi:hypothetical protein
VTKARVQPDLAPPIAPTPTEVVSDAPAPEAPPTHATQEVSAQASAPTPGQEEPSEISTQVEVAAPQASGESELPAIEESIAELGDATSDIIEYGGWEDLPQDGTQQIFEHIARFGSITEGEARQKLGSGRQFRRFSRKIDEYISHVSFDIEVVMVGGTKRYKLKKG